MTIGNLKNLQISKTTQKILIYMNYSLQSPIPHKSILLPFVTV